MREQSGIASLTGEGIAADAARSGAESTQAATSDYIDRIQSSNNAVNTQPGISGPGGLTNPLLGNLANNANVAGVNNPTTSNATNNNAGPGGQEDISPEGLL